MKKIECCDLEIVEKELKTDFKRGLSNDEVEIRQLKYGKNEIVEKKKKSKFKIFLDELNNPMIYVLLCAIIFTIGISIYETIECINNGENFNLFTTGDWLDVIIITFVILINAIIGTVQELKAENSLEALKKLSSPKSTVIRDGEIRRIDSSDLTIGDIVIIEEGDTIGADIRMIEAVNLKVNESLLTGESVSVEKCNRKIENENAGISDKENCCYMSTNVSYGRGVGVVYSIGMETEIGKIAKVITSESEQKTNIEIILEKLSKALGLITLFIVIAVLIIDFIWITIDGNGGDIDYYIEAVLSAISLAVAAIPEGLVAVVTIVLAMGVQRLVKVNTIVRKLSSVETLGSVNIVCSDKTGTLTQNKMTVMKAYVNQEIYDGSGWNENNDGLMLLAKGMALCSNASIENGEYGDPTEIALVDFARKLNLSKKRLESDEPRIEELPFDSVRKMMSTYHHANKKSVMYTKGAIDSILNIATKIIDNGIIRDMTEDDKQKIMEINHQFSSEALRVLGLGYKETDVLDESDLIFVGMVAMIDPPRPDSLQAVLKLKQAGITTVMITGDHIDTAYAIAKDLQICKHRNQCLSGKEIDMMSFDELKTACNDVRVFARVSPENKVMIVKAFQSLGNMCAMTGDGVNDAPSLKSADIGISMGVVGTDVAKESSDIILADDNFSSIEKAVFEGRRIYANIKKTVYFLLGSNIAEVFAMAILIILGMPAPLIAIHLLWVNLITDSLPAIALGVQPGEESLMNERPRPKNEGIFAHGGIGYIAGYGIIVTLGVIIAYFIPAFINNCFSYVDIKTLYEGNYLILHQAQTMAFTTLAFSELFHMLGMCNTGQSIINIWKNKNKMMYIALVFGIIMQILVVEVPFVSALFQTYDLNDNQWLWVIILSLLPLFVHEIVVIVKKLK